MRLAPFAALLLLGCEIATPVASPATTQASAAVSPTVAASVPAGRAVPFVLVAGSPGTPDVPNLSARATRATIVAAATSEELEHLLANERVATHVSGAPPLADGAAYLAVLAGPKAYLGSALQVTDVRAAANVLTIWIRETPPRGDTFLPLVGYPFELIRVARAEVSRGAVLEMRDVATGAAVARVTYCGSSRMTSPLDGYDPVGPECVWDAYSRGETAQWLRRSLTDEGGPIYRTLRAVPGGPSEVSVDDRGDGFAAAPGVRSFACDQIARSRMVGNDGRARVWFELTRCTGDATETAIG